MTATAHPASTIERKRVGQFRIHDSTVSIWEETVDEWSMVQVLRSVLARLTHRGWALQHDPDVTKNYPLLAPTHWYGKKGDLELAAETFGRMAQWTFFQNLVVENPNGGRHDSRKFARMPRHLRLPCAVEMTNVVRKLLEWGYQLDDKFVPAWGLARGVLRLAEDDLGDETPLARFNREWGTDRFDRDETGWPSGPYGNGVDRDGRPFRNGDWKYGRDSLTGRLVVGRVYTGINGSWCVGSSSPTFQARALFDCDRPDREPRRFVPGQSQRLHRELERALQAKAYGRVRVLAAVLERLGVAP